MKTNIKLLYANVRGLKRKTASLYDNIQSYQPQIVCLVETMFGAHDNLAVPGYKTIQLNRVSKPGGGIMMLLANQYANTASEIFMGDEDNEQICMRMKIKQRLYYIAVIYGKVESRSCAREIKSQYELLEEHIKKANSENAEIIIVGDFNAKIGHDIKGNESKVNKSGEELRKLAKNNQLTIVNTTQKCNGLWTRTNTQRESEKSILDYFLCSKKTYSAIKRMNIDEAGLLKFTKYVSDGNNMSVIESDHHTITVELNVCDIKLPKKTQTIKTMKNPESWRRFKEICEQFNEDQFNSLSDVHQQNNYISSYISRTAEKCSKKIKLTDGYLLTTDLKKELQMKRQLEQTLSRQTANRDPKQCVTKIQLKWVNERITRILTEKRTSRIQHMTEVLTTTKGLHDRNFWKLKKKILNPKPNDIFPVFNNQNQLCCEPNEQKQAYEEHYKEVLQTRPIHAVYWNHETTINQEFARMLKEAETMPTETFTLEELTRVIKATPGSTAPGTDRVTYDMIANSGNKIIRSLCVLYNSVLQSKEVPREWQELNIKSIYKNKGSKEDLKNQRGLFLSQTITKMFEKMVLNRIHEDLDNNITDFQNGARHGRSTSDNLFILRSALDYFKYYRIPTQLIFYDLEKCFDKLWLKDCMVDLWNSSVTGNFWQLIYKMNEKSRVTIETPAGPTNKFTINEIVKQGTVLAAKICSNTVDKLNHEMMAAGCGIYIGNTLIPNLAFQDDLAQVSISMEKARKGLQITEAFQDKKCMKFNASKTQVMILNRKLTDLPRTLRLNNQIVPECRTYKYLGDILNDHHTYDDLIAKRISRARHTGSEIIALTEREDMKIIAIQAGLKLFRTILLPQLYYNSETWSNIPNKLYEAFDRACVNFLRRLLRLPKSSPTDGVLAETGTYRAYEQINASRAIFWKKIYDSKNEAIQKVLKHQIDSELDCYWIQQVKAFVREMKVNCDGIEKIPTREWTKKIQEAVRNKYTDVLDGNKATKTKHITQWKQQEYMTKLPANTARDAIRFRLKMMDSAKYYRAKYSSDRCPLCNEAEEDIVHMLICKFNACSISIEAANSIYVDLHSDDPAKVLIAVEQIKRSHDQRKYYVETIRCHDR